MKLLVAILLAPLALLSVATDPQPVKAGRVAVSKPRAILELSNDNIRGTPVRLSWSPDGRLMYLRTVERDLWANEKDRHYLLGVGDGRVLSAEGEPDWSAKYWAWKADYGCPGAPEFRIETETRSERKSATNAGAGGSLAQNSGDPYGPGSELGPQGAAIISGALQSQTVNTTTLKLKGRVLAQFVNARPILGLVYGWAPAGFDAIAYAGEKRALEIMDRTGARFQMKQAKGVLLPAWSDNARMLAWLAQQGRGKYVLMVADVNTID
jgi:hypothetical protein